MEKDKLIQMLKECNAIQFGRFVLTSGAISDYYVDIKKASTNPKILKKVAESMEKFTEGYELIAGMELGAVPILVALSLQTNIPFVIIRKEKRKHGKINQIVGNKIEDKRVLIIEDVTTSGSSVIKAIQLILENHGIVDEVVVLVDRESGAEEKLKKINVNLLPILSISEILKNKK
jgi:orotate phosphoribosyltransferase